jgi:hypothetical protein
VVRKEEGRSGDGEGGLERNVGWFVTVDGNAHVKRHVRRRRSGGGGGGGGTKGGYHREPRGMVREAVGSRAFGPGARSSGDAVLIARTG